MTCRGEQKKLPGKNKRLPRLKFAGRTQICFAQGFLLRFAGLIET